MSVLTAGAELAQMSETDRAIALSLHRLGVEGWMRAFLRAQALIDQTCKRLEVSGLAPEVALLSQVLSLQSLALKATTSSPMSASREIDRETEGLLRRIERAYRATVVAALEDATPQFTAELSANIRAELQAQHTAEIWAVREQFDMLEQAATTAQAEASAAERRVRELEEELGKARFEVSKLSSRVRDGERLGAVEQALKDEQAAHQALRESVILREREAHTLTRQVSTLQHDNHALRTQLAQAQAAPAAKESDGYRLPRVVDALSFRAWLAAQGITAHVEGQVCTTAPLSDAVLREWEAAHPDALSRRQQLGLRSAV